MSLLNDVYNELNTESSGKPVPCYTKVHAIERIQPAKLTIGSPTLRSTWLKGLMAAGLFASLSLGGSAGTRTESISRVSDKTTHSALLPRYVAPSQLAKFEPKYFTTESHDQKALTPTQNALTENPKPSPKARKALKPHPITPLDDSSPAQRAASPPQGVLLKPLTTEQRYQANLRLAAKHLQEAKHEDAERLLNRILDNDPTRHEARLLLAELLSQQSNENAALLLLSNAILRYPNHLPYLNTYSILLSKNGRYSLAINAVQHALEEDPQNAQIHGLLAGLLQQSGNPKEAQKSYLSALELDNNQKRWWLGLAISSDQAKDKTTAIKAFKKALGHSQPPETEQYIENRLKQLVTELSTNNLNKKN
ncbi:MAG: tetratricopeptide repeat protein [Gammaproteobacteria bacterium]|nr:tetratricopeptide repeat protein [Gammaproteobacteria bacterium]